MIYYPKPSTPVLNRRVATRLGVVFACTFERTLRDIAGHRVITAVNAPTQGVGAYGPQLQLNGINTYVSVPTPAGISNSTPGTYALRFFLRARANLGEGQPILINSGGNHYWGISGAGSNLAFFNGAWRAGSGTVATGAWHHAAFVWGGGNVRMYLNGAEVYNQAQTPGPFTTTLNVGARTDAVNSPFTLDGAVSDFIICNRALSAGEIQRLANHPRQFELYRPERLAIFSNPLFAHFYQRYILARRFN